MLTESEITQKFWSHVDKESHIECWLWKLSLNHGYGQIWINGKRWIASRLAWHLTYGNIPIGVVICHACDNPTCVNPSHLFQGTQAKNLSDMRAKYRHYIPKKLIGSQNYRTHLTDEDVKAIRHQYTQGVSLRVLGRMYGIAHTAIASIVHRRTWTHIK